MRWLSHTAVVLSVGADVVLSVGTDVVLSVGTDVLLSGTLEVSEELSVAVDDSQVGLG